MPDALPGSVVQQRQILKRVNRLQNVQRLGDASPVFPAVWLNVGMIVPSDGISSQLK